MTNQRTLVGVLAGALLITLLVLGAFVTVTLVRPAQAQSIGITGLRQITVVGNGEVQATPDTAQVQIGVETNAATTQEALNQNNQQVANIIARIQELGVAEADIQTSNFNIYANYDENGRQVTGYTVSNIVTVTIRNLTQTGTLLDQVVQAGANRIYGITFSVDDPSQLLVQAREQAVADARAKAQQLAQNSNASIGEILVITENIGSVPPVPMLGRADVGQGASQVPVQPGEQTFTAQVQVTFELR